MSSRYWQAFAETCYRYRWLGAALSTGLMLVALALGMRQVTRFSSQVDQLRENPANAGQPRLFDMRTDIWFDPDDSGLAAYRDIEAKYIAEDLVIVAFEEKQHPWGVFNKKSLDTIQRLTEKIERVPYVRSVRSLTSSPWIRWGEAEPGESGMLVSDLFEGGASRYNEGERLDRMIAAIGAERASQLVGTDIVRQHLGAGVRFADHPGEPRFINGIVSADGRTAALQIQVLRQKPSSSQIERSFGGPDAEGADVGPTLSAIEAQAEAVSAIRRIIAEESEYPVHLAGIPVLEQHFPEVGFSDMSYLGLMFLVMALLLFAIFKRAAGVVLPLLVVFLSIMGMNGLVWYAGDLINNMTATAPIVLTAVGLADAVHLVTAYYLERHRFDSKRELLIHVVSRNALPVLLTSLTTAVAFFSLVVSPIQPVQEFGYTAGIGTVFAYLLSMTLVPALLSLLPLPSRLKRPSQEVTEGGSGWAVRLLGWVLGHRRVVLGLSAALCGLAVLGLSRLDVESDLRMMFPEDDPVSSDIRWIEQRLGGAGDLDLVFTAPPFDQTAAQSNQRQMRLERLQLAERERSLSKAEAAELDELARQEATYQKRRIAGDAEFLAQVDAFERRLRQEAKDPDSPLAVLTSFDSGLSVLRRIHQVQNENSPDYYRVPEARDVPEAARRPTVLTDPVTDEQTYLPAQTASSLASQYYLQYENGARPSENLSSLVTQDRRGFRVVARIKSAPSARLLEAYHRIRQIANDEFPRISLDNSGAWPGDQLASLRMSGKHYLFINMLERFTDTLLLSLLIAAGVITLLISVVFRSLRLGLLSLIPNVLPLVIPLGILGLFGIPLDGPAVIVCTVALGVCVDDTIHLFTKFREAEQRGLSVSAALREAFERVGAAVTWTSVVLVFGFSVLALSLFRPNMMIGVLGGAMVALAWVADMFVTPALLSYLEPRSTSEQADSEGLAVDPLLNTGG